MSDRTLVTLTVLFSQADAAKALFNGFKFDEGIDHQKETTRFIFHEVNHGDLPFLPNLARAGIAYDSNWCDGADYEEGTEYLRFTAEGEAVETTVYIGERNPPLIELMRLIDKPQQLRAYLLDYRDRVMPAPLDSQQEINGKVYKTRQLIEPTPTANAN